MDAANLATPMAISSMRVMPRGIPVVRLTKTFNRVFNDRTI
jgi:hypothetical protein